MRLTSERIFAFPFRNLLFVFLVFSASCSKDGTGALVESVENEVAENEEQSEDQIDPRMHEVPDNFILHEGGRIVNYILEKEEYDKYLKDEGDFSVISKKIYEHYKDDFDFIFVLSNEEDVPEGLYAGISYKVQNGVEGIGTVIYDNTGQYGSEGRLKSIIHLPVPRFIVNGPFLHEIVHYWGNHGFVPTVVGGHWGYSNVGGQLGGFDELIDLGNSTYQGRMEGEDGFGTFANGGNSVPYGNLELYLMGLVDANELSDIQYAENPESVGFGKFTATNIKTITSAELIAEHGNRSPSVQDSQKEFDAIAVILSTEKLSDTHLGTISSNLENFSRKGVPDNSWGSALNFWQATREKASLNIYISEESIK